MLKQWSTTAIASSTVWRFERRCPTTALWIMAAAHNVLGGDYQAMSRRQFTVSDLDVLLAVDKVDPIGLPRLRDRRKHLRGDGDRLPRAQRRYRNVAHVRGSRTGDRPAGCTSLRVVTTDTNDGARRLTNASATSSGNGGSVRSTTVDGSTSRPSQSICTTNSSSNGPSEKSSSGDARSAAGVGGDVAAGRHRPTEEATEPAQSALTTGKEHNIPVLVRDAEALLARLQ